MHHPIQKMVGFVQEIKVILDKDNFVYISGRLKELINRGGEKISPVEIDTILWQNVH